MKFYELPADQVMQMLRHQAEEIAAHKRTESDKAAGPKIALESDNPASRPLTGPPLLSDAKTVHQRHERERREQEERDRNTPKKKKNS
jgi:hypothetical protein